MVESKFWNCYPISRNKSCDNIKPMKKFTPFSLLLLLLLVFPQRVRSQKAGFLIQNIVHKNFLEFQHIWINNYYGMKKMKQSKCLMISLIVAMVFMSIVYAEEYGIYQAPRLDGYVLYKTMMVDADEPEDGVKESMLKKYKNLNAKK